MKNRNTPKNKKTGNGQVSSMSESALLLSPALAKRPAVLPFGKGYGVLALVAASMVSAGVSVQAASATWTNVGFQPGFTTGANWGTGSAPGATSGTSNADVATFNGTGYQSISMSTGENLTGITFATSGAVANPFNFTGGSLLTSANATIQTDSTYLGVAAFNTPVTAEGALTLTSNGLAGSGLLFGTITTAANQGPITLTLNGSNSGFNGAFGNILTNFISEGASAPLKLSKSGTGMWFVGTANTYTGGTDLNGGTLVTGNATSLGTTGAISVLGNTTLRTNVGLTDPSARISISNLATLTFDTNNQAQTWAGLLGNAGAGNTAGLTKTGIGTLTITPAAGAVQSWQGATTVNMGTLAISGASQTAGFSNLVNSNSALVLGGGNLSFTGKVGFTNSQTFNGTTLNSGISGFGSSASTGTNTVDFGAITRNIGSLFDVVQNAGFTIKATGVTNDSGGVVRGVLYNGDLATSTAGTLGAVAYTTQNTSANWNTATANYVTTGTVTGAFGTGAINSLKLNFAGNNNLSITGVMSVNDGLIFGSGIGANASAISGGSITGPSSGSDRDLIVVNNDTSAAAGRTTISSTIKDYAASDFSGAGTDGVTNLVLFARGGGGALVLAGANTYTGNTYIGGGTGGGTSTVVVGGTTGASIGSSAATVYVNGGTGGSGNVLQVGNSDTFGDVKGSIVLNNGKLSLKRTDTFALTGTVSGVNVGGYISQDSTGTASVVLGSGTNYFQSLSSSAAGTLNLSGAGISYFNSAASGFNASSTTNFLGGSYYFAGTTNTGNTLGNWTINGATVTIASGRYFGNNGGTITLTSGTFRDAGDAMNQQGGGSTTSLIYNINGGSFITSQSSNNGGSDSFAPGFGTPTNPGNVIINQTGGAATIGSPDSSNIANSSFGNMVIGTGSTSHASTYNLSGGALRVYGGIASGGAAISGTSNGSNNFNWTGGTLTTVAYNATNLSSNDGVNSSSTGFLYQAGGTMAPGEVFNGYQYTGKTSITGNYTIDSGAVAIGIGSATASGGFHTTTANYDNISVTGTAALAGRLNVGLINSFTPTAVNFFDIITTGTTTGFVGNFSNIVTGTSGSSRVVLADGLSSFTENVDAANKRVRLNGYAASNTFTGASNTNWDTAAAASWSNFDPGATATPSTQASNAIAQFADGTSSTGAVSVNLNATRNVQGIQFSATGSRGYTIAGSGSIILDNKSNASAATISDTSVSGSNAINVPLVLNSNLSVSVKSGNTLAIGGGISETANGSTFTKTGLGTATLSGSNGYTGATIVSSGALIVSGSLTGSTAISTLAAGSLEVDGALLAGSTVTNVGTLQGTGSVGSVSVSANGTLAPGLTAANATIPAVGTLTTTGPVTFANGTAKLSIRLGESTANDADQLLVSGANLVSLNGATLNLTLGAKYAHTDGQLFDIINNATGTTSGLFSNGGTISATYGAGLTEIFNILTGVNSLGVAGTGVGFNDVVLQAQAVPEPSTWAMLVGGFGMLIGFRRVSRRRNA